MADKEIIVEIKYDTEAAVKSLNELTSSIEGEKVAQAKLKQELEQGKISQNKYSEEVAKSKDIAGQANKERNNTIKLLQSEKGSVDQLKAQIADITAKRNKLNQSTAEGKKQAQVYNAQLEKMKTALKGAQTGTKQTSGAFATFGKNLNSLPGPIGGVIRGFGGMTKAALAFIATPIGAVIAAIVLGFKALMSYLKGSEEGQNRLNKIMMVFKTIMGNLGDIVQDVGKWIFEAVTKPKEAIKQLGDFIQQNLINRFLAFGEIGKAIVKIFSKNWKEGFKDLANATIQLATGFEDVIDKAQEFGKKLGEEMEKDIAIAKRLADRQAALDLLQRKFLVEREKLEAQIAEARVKAADKENFTAEERIKFLEEALQKEMQILDTDFKIAKEKFEIKKAQNALSNSTKEDLDEQAQLEAEMFRVQRENATKRMALTAQLTSAQRELNKEITNTNIEDEKLQAEILKRRGEAIAKLAELKQKELEQDAQSFKEKSDLQKQAADEELAAKLEQQGILNEEIKLAKYEHKLRLQEIDNEYNENVRAQRQMELDSAYAGMQEIISATEGFANQRVNILSDAFSKIATINFEEVKSSKDAFIAIGSAAQGLTSLITSGNQAQLDDLEAKKQQELDLAGDNTAAKEAIEKKYNEKLVAVKKAQFKEEKRKATIDALIATALAVAKALPNIPLSILSGVLGAVQVATIRGQAEPEFSSNKVFAEGGVMAVGKSHSQGGINIMGDNGQYFGNMQGDEALFVLKKEASAEIAAYSQLNESHRGRSFFDRPVTHAAEGGQMSGVDVAKTVQEEIQRTPVIVRVGDIETGMTDFKNVKQAGVV